MSEFERRDWRKVDRIRAAMSDRRAEFRVADPTDVMALLDAIDALASRLFEPVVLPAECPPLVARLLDAVDQLVGERSEARGTAHDMATECMRVERERDEARARYAALCIGDPYSGDAWVDPSPAGVTLTLRDERDEARAEVERLREQLAEARADCRAETERADRGHLQINERAEEARAYAARMMRERDAAQTELARLLSIPRPQD